MELQVIQSKIHEIRGYRVMLDSDLAELYGTETKRLKEAVKRNIKRFPSDFMFELNKEEWENLRTQIATSKRGGIRYRPFAFTEQGVAMLSSVLGSDRAIEINIGIMRAFVSIRQFLLNTTTTTMELEDIRKQLENLREDVESLNKDHESYEKQLDDIYLALAQLAERKKIPRNPIGYTI